MFTFLCATNQAKDSTSNRACDFQIESVGNDGIWLVWLDMIEKNDFTVNKLQEDKDQVLKLGPDGDKCKWEREDMSLWRSPISKSERSRWKFKFQEKELVDSRTDEILRFWIVTLLNRHENWEHKGWSSNYKSS